MSTLAIERCLLQKLPSILSPEIICNLTDEEVQRIAAESSESAAERVLATEKLHVLESGIAELKRLKIHSAPMHHDNVARIYMYMSEEPSIGKHVID